MSLMRGCRGRLVPELTGAIVQMKAVLKQVAKADNLGSLLGLEGNLAAIYFGVFDYLLKDVPIELRFDGRNRRPPKDRVNALLSFGDAMLMKDVMNSVLAVGLEPALGFYHRLLPIQSAPNYFIHRTHKLHPNHQCPPRNAPRASRL